MAKTRSKGFDDISQVIDEIADEINSVLNNRVKEKYFEDIVLLYSFIENLLKWLVVVKIIWNKSKRVLGDEEVKTLRSFYKRISFYDSLNISLSLDLIDMRLFKRIDAIRQERNDMVHQFWIYRHRNNLLVLRKKLEKLANVANEIMSITNKLVRQVGINEVYEMFL